MKLKLSDKKLYYLMRKVGSLYTFYFVRRLCDADVLHYTPYKMKEVMQRKLL